jgi:MATE family multidrug resistance protein
MQLVRCWTELSALLATASPIVLIGLLNMTMSIVDAVMLGRYDAEGLAAAVVVSDLHSIVFNFSAGFAGVVTPQVATAIGARVRWHVCTIVRRTMLLVVVLGVFGAGLILFSPRLLEALGVRQAQGAGTYAAFMAGTYLFMVLFALARAVLSALSRPRFALLAIAAALPLKVAANFAFIHGAWGAPELGVAGAGLASFLVAVLMGGSLTLYLFASPSFAEFDDPEPVPVDLLQLWHLARSGLLMGLVAVSETGVFLASTIVVGVFAPHEIVVHAVTFRLMAVGYLFVVGIGQAVTIRMAYLHARAARGLEVHAKRAIASCGLALAAIVLGLLVPGADPLGRLLAATIATKAELADLAPRIADLLPIAGPTLAAMIPAHMIAALLRARDDVIVPAGFAMASYWGVALTSMLLLAGAGRGAEGVWLSLLLGAAISSACFCAYLWTPRRRAAPCAAA